MWGVCVCRLPEKFGISIKKPVYKPLKKQGVAGTKVHMVAADDQTAVILSLSPGQSGEVSEGRK